jgi:hypothetical protein
MVRSPRQPAFLHVEWDFTAHGRTAGAPDQQTVSGACWRGRTVATNAIDPSAGANRDGLAAGDPGGGERGPAQRSHTAAAAAHTASKEGREDGQPYRPYGRHGGRRPPAWRLGASGGRRMPGIRSRTDRGLESAPDALPMSYLHPRNTVNTVAFRDVRVETCRVSHPRRQPPVRRSSPPRFARSVPTGLPGYSVEVIWRALEAMDAQVPSYAGERLARLLMQDPAPDHVHREVSFWDKALQDQSLPGEASGGWMLGRSRGLGPRLTTTRSPRFLVLSG